MTSRPRGRPPYPDILTPTEWQILHMVRHGFSDRKIARVRGISLLAVRFHVRNIRSKLAVERRSTLRNSAHPFPNLQPRNGALPMSGSLKLGPLGQVSLTVSNIARAETFYKDTLGLPHLFTFGTLAFFDLDGTRLFLTEPERSQPGQGSVLYFRVSNVQTAYAELEAKGVTMTGAPHMIFRHPDGVEEWMAFFEDPDKNLLALIEQRKT